MNCFIPKLFISQFSSGKQLTCKNHSVICGGLIQILYQVI
jgi:hypothetical protein